MVFRHDLKGLMEVALAINFDADKGGITGAVKWYNPDPMDNKLSDLGCAEVSCDCGNTVYYLGNDGIPTATRTNTNPANGYFMLVNVIPGSYTLTSDVDGNVETASVPRVFADSLTYLNINYLESEYATDPEPYGCVK